MGNSPTRLADLNWNRVDAIRVVTETYDALCLSVGVAYWTE